MTTPDRRGIVDRAHTANLADVGSPCYEAATVVDHNGDCHLALVLRSAVGNLASVYDADCNAVEHEQTGALPAETLRRIDQRKQP
jgi:hypothetical protein